MVAPANIAVTRWGARLTLPPNATLAERGCVVLDQPQQGGKHWSRQQIQSPRVITLLRLVFDTAALRGQCQDAP